MKINLKNIVLYLLGLVLMSFAVVIMKKTLLGMGAWDAVIINTQTILNIKLGYASLIINILLLSFVVIYKRSFKNITVIIPIAINTLLLNIWDSYVFNNLEFTSLLSKTISYGLGIILLPFGLSLIIYSGLPKMIYDELTFVLMEIFKIKHFGIIRLGFEVTGLIIAMILGLIGGDILMQIGISTLVVTLLMGPLIDFFLKVFKYEQKQEVVMVNIE